MTDNQNLENIVSRSIPTGEEESSAVEPTIVEAPKTDEPSMGELVENIRETTGIDLSSEYITPERAEEIKAARAAEKAAKAAALEGAPNTGLPTEPPTVDGTRMMSVEEFRQMGGDTTGERLTEEKAEQDAIRAHTERIKENEKADVEAMFDPVFASEEDRLKRLEATFALPKDDPRRKELFEGFKTDAQVAERSVTVEDVKESDRILKGVGGFDPDELMPSYTLDDKEADADTPKVEEKKEPTPDDDEEEYAEFVRNLPTATIEPFPDSPVTRTRMPQVNEVPSDWKKKKNSQMLGDQAFMNAVTRFKKERFGVVRAILPNSGFSVDVVGTGVVDMQDLYMNVSRHTKMYDYQMEQMRVLINNVVGTSPKVDPKILGTKIHYRDADMLAWAHICATLQTVEVVGNCTECGLAFRSTVDPRELLLNLDELAERRDMIDRADSIDDVSLMANYRVITSSDGMEITLGHPSFTNEFGILKNFVTYYNNMDPQTAYRFSSKLDTMYMIRKIILPNGIPANSLLQIFIALGMLSQEDMKLVDDEIEQMQKQIIRPKFGIRNARCPHCGKISGDIPYESMVNLLFMHTQVSEYLNAKKTDAESHG